MWKVVDAVFEKYSYKLLHNQSGVPRRSPSFEQWYTFTNMWLSLNQKQGNQTHIHWLIKKKLWTYHSKYLYTTSHIHIHIQTALPDLFTVAGFFSITWTHLGQHGVQCPAHRNLDMWSGEARVQNHQCPTWQMTSATATPLISYLL